MVARVTIIREDTHKKITGKRGGGVKTIEPLRSWKERGVTPTLVVRPLFCVSSLYPACRITNGEAVSYLFLMLQESMRALI